MKREAKEITVGGLGLLGLILLFGFNYGGRDLTVRAATNDYLVKAVFNRIDGMSEGSEVHLGGIKVGSVDAQELDEHYRAVMMLRIDSDVKLPRDTSAAIHTDGLFGSKFVVLEPGGDEDLLQSGDEITFTQDSMIVGELLELIIAQGRARVAKDDGRGDGKSAGAVSKGAK
jgi:phospholipid/cholesterol/gamma-HCH transport system substrate-binding protein